MDTNTNSKIKSLYTISMILVVFGFLVGVASLSLFLFKNGVINTELPIDTNKFSHFGDLFGGVIGSLWALSGVLLFFLALRLQTKEFQLQRKELKETRKVFSEQSRLIKIEQFENRLFSLLQLLEASINNSKITIQIDSNDTDIFGRTIFEELSYEIAGRYHTETNNKKISIEDSYSLFNRVYSKVYYEHMSFVEHYTNQITQLINVVAKHSASKDSTNINYFSYIVSHLSKYELLILSYHAIFKKDGVLYSLLVEYNLNKDLLVDIDYSENESNYIPDIIDVDILLDSYKLNL